MNEVEMVEMLVKASQRGLWMSKTALQFHDLVINESKERLKQARCGTAHVKSKVKKPVAKKPS